MAKIPTLSVAVLCCLQVAVYSLQPFPRLFNVRNFEDFVQQTGIVYADENERKFRESIFAGKKTFIDLGNKNAKFGLFSFRMQINVLADRTKSELGLIYGSKLTFQGEDLTSRHINFVTAKTNTENLPESFDWREKGGVAPPGFQGFNCGSCWSFATIGALEGHLFRRTGLLVPMSQQNLVDCVDDYGSMGCDGGFQEYAFEYIRDHGVTLANKYPYTQMENAQCKQNETGGVESLVRIRDYARIKPGDEDKMKEVIATLGPLACSVNAAPISFEQYMGGIYDDDECNSDEVNHSVVVVGYGTENGRDYWIIKNSYSQNWGEDGFMRILRNANSFCGIASECSYPIL